MADLTQQAGNLNIEIEAGTDFQTTLTWRDENAALVNLTGYTARLQIRTTAADSGTPVLALTNGAGLTLGGVNGTIIIDITNAQNDFGSKSYVYDLELTDGSSKITRLVEGTITSILKVTK